MRVPIWAVLGQWTWFSVSPLLYSRTWPIVELVSLLNNCPIPYSVPTYVSGSKKGRTSVSGNTRSLRVSPEIRFRVMRPRGSEAEIFTLPSEYNPLREQYVLDFHEYESSRERSKKIEFPYPGKSEIPLTINPDLGMTLLFDIVNSSTNQSPTRECSGRIHYIEQ